LSLLPPLSHVLLFLHQLQVKAAGAPFRAVWKDDFALTIADAASARVHVTLNRVNWLPDFRSPRPLATLTIALPDVLPAAAGVSRSGGSSCGDGSGIVSGSSRSSGGGSSGGGGGGSGVGGGGKRSGGTSTTSSGSSGVGSSAGGSRVINPDQLLEWSGWVDMATAPGAVAGTSCYRALVQLVYVPVGCGALAQLSEGPRGSTPGVDWRVVANQVRALASAIVTGLLHRIGTHTWRRCGQKGESNDTLIL
jgi:hypothetical protein